MDKKQNSPKLSQAEPLPTQEKQVPPSRKRQIDNESDTDDKPQLKRARLTRQNLARFNKMGKGKEKESKKSSSQRDSTSGSRKSKTTSTTTAGFALQAHKNGILDPLGSKPPTNLEDLRKRHTRPRETVSPTESRFKYYVNDVGNAGNEVTMVVETSGHLLKKYEDDEGYNRSFNRSFTGFLESVGFNDGLSAPQPDFVEGLGMQEYDPFPVDEHVSGAVLYEDNPRSLTLPHIAGEWKGSGKNMEEARLQSAYDGASLVYARKQALSYMGKSDPQDTLKSRLSPRMAPPSTSTLTTPRKQRTVEPNTTSTASSRQISLTPMRTSRMEEEASGTHKTTREINHMH
uniref:Uncharacterized protein n=1 Tax=Bionectria ochroleuca TaxID=29856 RepID=A0A8H7K2F6_BIOOC